MKTSMKILLIVAAILITLLIILVVPERKKEFRSKHFDFFFSSSIDNGEIASLSKLLESEYKRIGDDLHVVPSSLIQVNIYNHRWRYIKATGNWGASGNIEGISKLHFLNESGGQAENQKVAVHEFTHTLTLKLLLDRELQPIDSKQFDKKFSTFPTWLWEAVSVYEARQFVDPKTLPYFKNEQHPCIAELNSRLMGGKIYSCGYTIIEFILENYGREDLIRLIENYGNIQTTLHVADNEFCNRWYAFVKQKYLK